MFKMIALFLTSISVAYAQTPQELLRLAQETYKSPDGYEIKGKGSVQPPDSSWRISFDVIIAAAPSPFDNPRPAAHVAGRVGGQYQYKNVVGGADEKPPSLTIPFAVTGQWDRFAANVESVTETGTETLPLNGAPSACRVLQVQYKQLTDAPKSSPVTYSICSDRHLVLKKILLFSTGSHGTGPPALWTIVFDTARFDRPAPQWVLDMKDIPAVTIRKSGSVTLHRILNFQT